MKKSLLSFAALGAALCSLLVATAAVAAPAPSKVLVAYYSRADENYEVGVIEKGNTAIVAEMIAAQTGGTLFEIVPVKAYPQSYRDTTAVAKTEQSNNERPQIRDLIPDFEAYDTVFLGYPNWWGDLPMLLYTFMESYDWKDKTVLPFCTHGGSGLSDTVNTIRSITRTTVTDGLSLRGKTAQENEQATREAVSKFLSAHGF